MQDYDRERRSRSRENIQSLQRDDRSIPSQPPHPNDESQVFVGNISYETTEPDLVEVFSRYGKVIEAKLIVNHDTLRSRGFAFITFSDPQSADDACIGMQGFELQGRNLRVDKSSSSRKGKRFNNDRPGYDNYPPTHGYNSSGYERDRGGLGGSSNGGNGGYDRVDRGYDNRGYDRGGGGYSVGGGDRGIPYDRHDRGGYIGDRGGPRGGGYDRGHPISGGPISGGPIMYDRGGYPPDRYDRGERSSYPPNDRHYGGYSGGSDRSNIDNRGYIGGGGGGGGYSVPDRGGYSHNDRPGGYSRDPSAPGGSKGVCFQWQKGECRFGNACRYSHDGPPGGGIPSSISRGGYDSYDAPR